MTIYQTLMNEIKDSNMSGTYIQPVPIGLQVKLYYSDKGILTKAVCYSGGINVAIPFNVVTKLTQSNVIIQRLQTYKAECKVLGVLVAPTSEFKFTKLKGNIPDCLEIPLLNLAETKPEVFKFYALDVQPMEGLPFPAAASLSRLAVMKFNTITGLVSNSTPDASHVNIQLAELEKAVKTLNPDLPLLAGIYIHGTTSKLVSTNLKCGKVHKFTYTLDINGYVHGQLKCDLGTGRTEVFVPYSQIVKHNLSTDSFVILDASHNIQYVSQPKIFSRTAPPTITCPICGKNYSVHSDDVIVTCDDPHCASMMYSQVCRMLSKLDLPELEAATFTSYIESGKLKTLHDVFSLPEYEDCEVQTTLSTLLEAITPTAILRGDMSNMSKFVMQAGSANAVSYYVHSPSAIENDLKLDKHFTENLKIFWSDSYNVDTFDTFTNSPHVEVITADKKFEGDLIFRNKLICLTGEFKHGSYDEMISILKSYAGTPTVEFSPQVNFVVAGHLGKTDPNILEKAQAYNIPIFEELDFFKAYQIDDDLSKFHLI